MRTLGIATGLLGLAFGAGCINPNDLIFPVWPANFFDEPPAEVGPFNIVEQRIEIPDGADGSPSGVTLFKPTDANEPLPMFVWVLGSNVQPYYQQSLHEILASWGYVVLVPDARPLTFTDFQYHRRNTDLAKQAIQLAIDGTFEVEIDPNRIAAGGYSIGGMMALFAAAEDARIGGTILWAPTDSPFWTGVDPEALFPLVTSPVFFLLAELDDVSPFGAFPREVQEKLVNTEVTEFIIPMGLHLYFQQPTAADSLSDPLTTLTRFEQQGIAITQTRAWLEGLFGETAP